mmetsp:Transcript_48150/g.58300  ORF Transcript_48150/g.58300 Transcript_48150/m.58300 type:complete len:234 (-) Transcript_48150:220-921(-)
MGSTPATAEEPTMSLTSVSDEMSFQNPASQEGEKEFQKDEGVSPETYLPTSASSADGAAAAAAPTPAGHTPALSSSQQQQQQQRDTTHNTDTDYIYASPVEPPMYTSTTAYHTTSSSSFDPSMLFTTVQNGVLSASGTFSKYARGVLSGSSSRSGAYESVSPLIDRAEGGVGGEDGLDHDEELGYGRTVTYTAFDYVQKFCKDLYGMFLERLDVNQRIAVCVVFFLFLLWLLH